MYSVAAKVASALNPLVYALSHPKYREALAREFPSLGLGKHFQSYDQPMLLVPGEIFRLVKCKNIAKIFCCSWVYFVLLCRKFVKVAKPTVDFSRETLA